MRYLILIFLLAGCLKTGEQKIVRRPVYIQIEAISEDETIQYSNIIYIK